MSGPDVFDELAERYDRWFDDHPHTYASELAAVRSLTPSTGRGLEIGVGTGRFACPLGITDGVEPSAVMADVARSRGVEVVQAFAEILPIEDGSYDYTLMVTTVCFLRDVNAAFQETYRILRPGGVLVVGLIDRDSPLGTRYLAKRSDNPFYRQARFHSATELEKQLASTGFSRFEFCQTLFREPETMTEPDPFRPGHGEGGFVVVRCVKAGADVKSVK